jgi:predicted kinase
MKFNNYLNYTLNEGINDKNIFKAVFLAGGPGSGKSFISDKLFKGTGAKVINSDEFFEYLLKKKELPMKIDPNVVDMYDKQMEQRSKAKELTKNKAMLAIDGMLPLIVDGTGKDFEKINKQRIALEKIGYDTGMVFVNTSLDVAKERNSQRKRSVPESVVEKGWKQVQDNMGKFQSAFNGNFLVVDNSKKLNPEEIKKLNIDLARKSMKFMNGKIQNQTGKKITELLQKTKGKTLSDLPDSVPVEFKP